MAITVLRLNTMGFRLKPACLIFTLLAVPGLAQQIAVPANTIQEIIVTAQKREQNAQAVAITMTVLDAEELRARAYDNLPDAIAAISNVELFEDYPSAGIPSWIIRGVGLQDFNSNNTPTASVYVDESYQTSVVMGAARLFDVQRLEVLKGPQGGLYGRNTTGGAVLLNTQRAVPGENSGSVRLQYGSWDAASIEAYSNLSLSEAITWRLSGHVDSRGNAWQRSLANGDKHGENELWDVRSWLHFRAADDLDIEWKIQGGVDKSDIDLGRTVGVYDATGAICNSVLSGQRDDANCLSWAGFNQLVQALPNTNLVNSQSLDGSSVLSDPINQQDNEYLSNLLLITKQFNQYEFTSISSYEVFDYGVQLDLDGSTGEFAHRISSSDIQVFSQEFRLLSDPARRLSWLAGITFSDEQFEERRRFLFRDNFLVIANMGLSLGNVDYDQNTSSASVYGNLRYEIDPQWAVNVSMRYTDEDKEYRNGNLYVPGAVPFYIFRNLSRDYSLENNFSGNLSLEWMPQESLLIYASIADGYKSGGFYGGFPSFPQEIDPYKEETITAYEIGFKNDFSSSLRLNAAAFYYDYEDVQGFVSRLNALTNTAINVLSNQGDARHTGVELALDWYPADNLSLTINLGYLDAKIKSNGIMTLDIFQTAVPISGRRPYAPLWNGDRGMTYQLPLMSQYNSIVGLYYNFRSKFSGAQNNLAEEAIYALDGYELLNANIDLIPQNDDWKLSFWVKNLLDEQYRTRVKSDGLLSYADLFGLPRSAGIALQINW